MERFSPLPDGVCQVFCSCDAVLNIGVKRRSWGGGMGGGRGVVCECVCVQKSSGFFVLCGEGMLAQSEPPGEEEKVVVLKCCSRFVSFHLLCNESCCCCERLRRLTVDFIVKPQGERTGARTGLERKRSRENPKKPTSPHLKPSQHFGSKKSGKDKLFSSFFFFFLLLPSSPFLLCSFLLLLTASHASQMNPLAWSSEKKLKQRARKRSV